MAGDPVEWMLSLFLEQADRYSTIAVDSLHRSDLVASAFSVVSSLRSWHPAVVLDNVHLLAGHAYQSRLSFPLVCFL